METFSAFADRMKNIGVMNYLKVRMWASCCASAARVPESLVPMVRGSRRKVGTER